MRRLSFALLVLVAAGCGGSETDGCRTGLTRCGQVCLDLQADPDHCGDCGNPCGGETPLCSAGTCVAACGPALPDECAGGCVNTDTDPLHCGDCGTVCAAGDTCTAGACSTCAGEVCGGTCVDTRTDEQHCGGCDRACLADTPFCIEGTCKEDCGESGFILCGNDCVNPSSDVANCGGCDNDCGPGGQCVSGNCLCGPTTTDCGAYCADTTSDPANCGGCGKDCDADQTCVDSDCVCDDPTLLACGKCIDADVDPKHCGDCDTRCADDEMCAAGQCACRPPLVSAGGVCRDPTSDATFCGNPPVTCGDATPLCQEGQCVAACDEALEQCDRSCVDTGSHPLHCGQCDQVCAAEEVCAEGECRDFDIPAGCDACPCAACADDLCCTYPGTGQPICVDGDECP